MGNEKRFAENRRRGMKKILRDDRMLVLVLVAKTFSPMAGVFSKGTKRKNIELRGEKKQII